MWLRAEVTNIHLYYWAAPVKQGICPDIGVCLCCGQLFVLIFHVQRNTRSYLLFYYILIIRVNHLCAVLQTSALLIDPVSLTANTMFGVFGLWLIALFLNLQRQKLCWLCGYQQWSMKSFVSIIILCRKNISVYQKLLFCNQRIASACFPFLLSKDIFFLFLSYFLYNGDIFCQVTDPKYKVISVKNAKNYIYCVNKSSKSSCKYVIL